MALIRRTAWQNPAEPIASSSKMNLGAITKGVIHYPGADWADLDFDNDGDVDKDDTIIVLRNAQHGYLTQRGYSLGYNFAVDQAGRTFEIRGTDLRCAANQEVNDSAIAVLIVADADDPATLPAICAVQRILWRSEQLMGRAFAEIGPHSKWATNTTHTSCPGTGISTQVAAGVFTPPRGRRPVLKAGEASMIVAYAKHILIDAGFDLPSNRTYDSAMVKVVADIKKFYGWRIGTGGERIGPRFWKILDQLAIA